MNQWLGLLGVIVLVAGFIFLLRKSADSNESLEHELRGLCRGDREMMERLISHEVERGKDRSREAAVRAAIHSYKRDNR